MFCPLYRNQLLRGTTQNQGADMSELRRKFPQRLAGRTPAGQKQLRKARIQAQTHRLEGWPKRLAPARATYIQRFPEPALAPWLPTSQSQATQERPAST